MAGPPTSNAIAPTDWVAYRDSLIASEPFELQSELASLSQRHSSAPSDETALKLALLLSGEGSELYDARRAAEFADEAVTLASTGSAAAAVASLAAPILHRLAMAEETLGREQQRRAQLQAQVEALIELEEQLNADELGNAP